MAKDLNIKISGEAGQGMQTIGQALCLLYKNIGLNIFALQDYMSRVRGGNNFFQLRISESPVYAARGNCDILVALDKASVAIHKAALGGGGIVVLDRKKFGIEEADTSFFDLPMYDLADKAGGSDIFVNSVACGALAGLTGVGFEHVEHILTSLFGGKSGDIILQNVAAARSGYEFVRESSRYGAFQVKCCASSGDMVMNGNDAVSLGAIRAGCKFYTAYPMTPSTDIMNFLARYSRRYGIVVEQAEDEIAAVNMALGASFAGVRSMTGTSGGGFALMEEGVSLAGMTETPVVIFLGQRPAPATGFPTRTEQADLDMAIHAGHGEFARAVLAPGSIEEAFSLTVKAFDLAEKYQIPVIILSDQHLADCVRNVAASGLSGSSAGRFIISKEDSKKISGYLRYALTPTGISPRAVPSWIADPVYADSDEHTEQGHITEDGGIRRAMVEKRLYKKMAGLSQETVKPVTGGAPDAKNMLLGFGSTFGVIRETADVLKDRKFGFMHLSQVWPFPEKELLSLVKKGRKLFTVENNASGQLARLIRRETGVKVDGSILKFDGRPFVLDELVERVKAEC